MKLLKRAVSLFLAGITALTMMCVGTINAGAANLPNYTVTVGYEEYVNGKGKGNYVVELSNISNEEFMYLRKKYDIAGGNLQTTLAFDNDVELQDFSSYDMYTGSVFFPMSFITIGSKSYEETKLSCSIGWDSVKYVLDPNDSICAKAIKKIEASSKCYVSLGLYGETYYSYYSGTDNWSSYEVNVKNRGKEAEKIKTLAGEEPVAKGKESDQNYSVNGYYNSDKSKYCVKIDGIKKEEYDFLQQCSTHYGLLDGEGWTDGIMIQISNEEKKQAEYGSFIQAIIDKSEKIYSLNTDFYVYFKRSNSLTGKFVKSGKNYAYVFYIDTSTNDGKKTANALAELDTCDAVIRLEYHRIIGSATSKSGFEEKYYSYYYKDTKVHEYKTKANYSKTVGDLEKSTESTNKNSPKKTTLTVKKTDEKYTFSWDKVSGADKYQIYYSTDGKNYKKLANVSGKKTSYSTKKLDESKTYSFKIRSYKKADGKTYYSKYSKVVKK